MGSSKEKAAKKGLTPAARLKRKLSKKSREFNTCSWCRKKLTQRAVVVKDKYYCDGKCVSEHQAHEKAKANEIQVPPFILPYPLTVYIPELKVTTHTVSKPQDVLLVILYIRISLMTKR